MDLILFEPGELADTVAKNTNNGGFSLSLGSIDGLPDQDFAGCIELVSMNQSMKQQVTTDVSNSARTSGRPVISDFTCVKYVDALSPEFYRYCLAGKTLDNENRPCRIFLLRNSGDKTTLVMQYVLRNVIISDIQFQSHPNDMATEAFQLNSTEISWSHHSVDSVHSSGWNLLRNRPVDP